MKPFINLITDCGRGDLEEIIEMLRVHPEMEKQAEEAKAPLKEVVAATLRLWGMEEILPVHNMNGDIIGFKDSQGASEAVETLQ